MSIIKNFQKASEIAKKKIYQNKIYIMNNLLVSVLMPAYNAGLYISEAIQSIINQTYTDRELIIIDDCSTDDTWDIISQYGQKDKRIIALQNKENLWIAGNRNKLLEQAKWEYIMRQDADDISFDYRMQKQLEQMILDKDIWIIWWTLEVFDENGIIWDRKYSNDNDQLHKSIFRYSPVAQPWSMVRKSVLEKIGIFDIYYPPAEDLDLSFRIWIHYKFANLDQKVIRYRENKNNSTFSKLTRMEIATVSIRLRYNWCGTYKMNFADHMYNIIQYISIFVIPAKFKIWLFNILRKYM